MIDRKEFIARIVAALENDWADEQVLENGEIVIRTEMFEWSDGSVHDCEECPEIDLSDILESAQ